jgi:hypothetical protein
MPHLLGVGRGFPRTVEDAKCSSWRGDGKGSSCRGDPALFGVGDAECSPALPKVLRSPGRFQCLGAEVILKETLPAPGAVPGEPAD